MQRSARSVAFTVLMSVGRDDIRAESRFHNRPDLRAAQRRRLYGRVGPPGPGLIVQCPNRTSPCRDRTGRVLGITHNRQLPQHVGEQ